MKQEEIKSHISEISECPLFKEIPVEGIEEFLSDEQITLQKASEGDLLPSGFMYIIMSGTIAVEKCTSDNRFVTMTGHRMPNIVNIASALGGDREMSLLKATKDSSVIQVAGKSIKEFIHKNGQFAENVTDILVNRIGFLNKKITSFSGYSAYARLAAYLKENEVNGEVILPMKIGDFADRLGVARASLYRAFDTLKEEGIITQKGRTIHIIGTIK